MICLSKERCSGCEACANICPANAIRMERDEEGFLYPRIDAESCTKCSLCEKHCPVLNGTAERFLMDEPLAVYAGWSLNTKNRMSSSSGGVFGEFAEYILSQGGYVAGAVFTEDHLVEHRLINSKDELPALKKSKYLQSHIGTVFPEIKKLLKSGKKVLFVGTPCQCAGLLAFLGEKPEDLLLCDFVCHGVNSPLVHQRYILEVEEKLGESVAGIDHRDKSDGWEQYQFAVLLNNGQKKLLGGKRTNPFLRGFLANLYLRRSCFKCRFKGVSRPFDITIGDCWGYHKSGKAGVSMVIANTEKGKQLLESVSLQITCENYPVQLLVEHNASMIRPAEDKMKCRDYFFEHWKNERLNEAIISILGN